MNAYNITIKATVIPVEGKVNYKSKSFTGLVVARKRDVAEKAALEHVKKCLRVPEGREQTLEVKKTVNVPSTFMFTVKN